MTRDRLCRSWVLGLAAGLVVLSGAAVAQQVDYDPGRADALVRCDEQSLRGREAQAARCYRALADRAGPLLRAEALWGLGDLQGANEAFRDAVAAAPQDVQARVRWGRLFLATGQYQDAMRLFEEALAIAPDDYGAGVARLEVAAERFSGGVDGTLEQLLAAAPERIEGHLVAARVALEAGQLPRARAAAQRALELARAQRRAPLEAQTLLAAVELVAGRDPAPLVRQVLDYNPRYGTLFERLGHFEVIRRRYREADAWYARAVQVQPGLPAAHREYGLNLMRLGDMAGARAQLEQAYAGDRFSTATVNTLRLLDSLGQYRVVDIDEPPLRLQLHEKEAAALEPYVAQLAGRSIATFAQRYGYMLDGPVTVELYPEHDDFAVRTVGLPGIGLLGVTFGHVVAMDSPSGRKSGDFHWGSTLWHEMAHVFTLSATQHRVPRWLSEGLSMFEEWASGPTPGVSIGPEVLDAFAEGKFLAVTDMDQGFLRPAYEGQVQVSYAQAGLMCTFAEDRWGMPALVAFLDAFRDDVDTATAVRQAFDVEPAAFDAQFQAYVQQRFAPYLAAPQRWRGQLRAANGAVEAKDWAGARRAAVEAIGLFPEYTGGGNAYQALAAAGQGLGDAAAAIEALEAWRGAGGWDPDGLRTLAQLLDEAGRQADAAQVLEAVNYVDPLAPAGHARLGDLLLALERPAEALREFQVLQALGPLDGAAADYGLARALWGTGDATRARRAVLRALEAAPRFRPAQKLLLEMTGETSP